MALCTSGGIPRHPWGLPIHQMIPERETAKALAMITGCQNQYCQLLHKSLNVGMNLNVAGEGLGLEELASQFFFVTSKAHSESSIFIALIFQGKTI